VLCCTVCAALYHDWAVLVHGTTAQLFNSLPMRVRSVRALLAQLVRPRVTLNVVSVVCSVICERTVSASLCALASYLAEGGEAALTLKAKEHPG
jgi:hypothetical protein